jgi:hypothetical protein
LVILEIGSCEIPSILLISASQEARIPGAQFHTTFSLLLTSWPVGMSLTLFLTFLLPLLPLFLINICTIQHLNDFVSGPHIFVLVELCNWNVQIT